MEADSHPLFFPLPLSSAVPAFNKAFCEWAGDKRKVWFIPDRCVLSRRRIKEWRYCSASINLFYIPFLFSFSLFALPHQSFFLLIPFFNHSALLLPAEMISVAK